MFQKETCQTLGDKKSKSIFKELKNFLPKKLSLSSQKYGFRIRDPEKPIPDPGVKKAPDLQHCHQLSLNRA
jgi:hypothetical protein